MLCNDAGWICGVLCMTDAENLRRVRELLRGKFAPSLLKMRCTLIFALPNAALTQARMLRCLKALNREFGRRQEFCAAHARETRETFATNSRIFGFLVDPGVEHEPRRFFDAF